MQALWMAIPLLVISVLLLILGLWVMSLEQLEMNWRSMIAMLLWSIAAFVMIAGALSAYVRPPTAAQRRLASETWRDDLLERHRFSRVFGTQSTRKK